jgi:hypothetical protein
MTAPTDTHRRAAIRGREAVAQSRIRSAVWSARLFALIVGALSIFPLLQADHRNWLAVAVLLLLALAVLGLSEMLRRGNLLAAGLLLGAFLLAKLSAWLLAGEPWWHGIFWTLLIAGALANGLWGSFAMAAIRREAATIPPAPPRSAAPGGRQSL